MAILRDLSCVISDKEKEDFEQELFSRHTALRAKEQEKKDIAKQFSEEIKELDDRIDVLVRVLRTGSEFREVRCEYRNNHETGLRELIRTDTGEVIDTAGLSLFDDETGSEASADESTSDGEAGIVHVPGEGEGEWEEAEEGPRALIGDGSEDADYEIVEDEEEGAEA